MPKRAEFSVDERFMLRALELSRCGRHWASPNPHVGCVLVRRDEIVGSGFTQPAGGAHAEVQALAQAGDAALGATAYVTLEPCAHFGRTGPCADALIAAGVARVVVAINDPNPLVAGAGIARLRAAGIAVSTDVCAAQARAELQGFLLRMERGWGRVRLKLGCSLDGRTAMASGESQWITGAAARSDVQCLRAESAFIVTGAGTVRADDCSLTVRAQQLPLAGDALQRALHRTPTRVVLDSRLSLPRDAKVFSDEAPTVVFHSDALNPVDERQLEAVPASDAGLCLLAVCKRLGELGGNEVLVEAGATLAGAWLQAGLVDELVLYQAPLLLGSSARPLLNSSIERLADGLRLDIVLTEKVGDDLKVVARPKPVEV